MIGPNDMKPDKGTPKSIDEAISNGLTEMLSNTKARIGLEADVKIIKAHIRDFMAQKAFHKDETTARHYRELFYKVFSLNKEGK